MGAPATPKQTHIPLASWYHVQIKTSVFFCLPFLPAESYNLVREQRQAVSRWAKQ